MVGNGFDFGGTADVDYVFHLIGFCTDMDLMERNIYIHECWLSLHQKLGAVLSRDKGQILYWQTSGKYFLRWILSRVPLVITAGYMSQSRGLHWNRK